MEAFQLQAIFIFDIYIIFPIKESLSLLHTRLLHMWHNSGGNFTKKCSLYHGSYDYCKVVSNFSVNNNFLHESFLSCELLSN